VGQHSLAQTPEHRPVSGGHENVHALDEQMGVPTPLLGCGHTLPQIPQLFGSLVRSAQYALAPLPQSVSGESVEQAWTQLVPLQVTDPPVGAEHAVQDVVPHEFVDALLEQLPPHA
jgi:hypothetical protein